MIPILPLANILNRLMGRILIAINEEFRIAFEEILALGDK